MKIIILSFTLFFIHLSFHIILWRIKRPKEDIKILLIIFFVTPTLLIFFYSVSVITNLFSFQWFNLSEIVSVWVLVIALSAAYIQFYPAAQALSPSLKIMLLIDKKRHPITTLSDIERNFHQDKIIMELVEELINSGLVNKNENIFRLTLSGKRLLRFFICYRKSLGLEYTGG